MEHRKRNLQQHKVSLSTQTKIVMLQQKGVTGRPVVGGKDIINALALTAIKNAGKYDTSIAEKKVAAAIF